jgi:hypothetical protein
MSSKTSTLRLSVLDQSPIREGGTPADAFLTDTLPESHPGIRATPATPSTPEVRLPGSSNGSATYAAHFGLAARTVPAREAS